MLLTDARSAGRFEGSAPEPRPGLPSGHIPGSLNLPFTLLLKAGDLGSYADTDSIRDAFSNCGMVHGSKTILSCGSGVTAAVLAFGLDLIGKDVTTFSIYDGSWSEWAAKEDLPKATISNERQRMEGDGNEKC